MQAMQELFSSGSGAARLGVSLPTFKNYQKQGLIRPIGRMGKAFVFTVEEIDRLRQRIQPHKLFQPRLVAADAGE